MNRLVTHNVFGRIVSNAWSDMEFKQKLLSDPKNVLKQNGVVIPDSLDVKIVENTNNVVYFILPQKPDVTRDVLEEDLLVAVGKDTNPCMLSECVPDCSDASCRGADAP